MVGSCSFHICDNFGFAPFISYRLAVAFDPRCRVHESEAPSDERHDTAVDIVDARAYLLHCRAIFRLANLTHGAAIDVRGMERKPARIDCLLKVLHEGVRVFVTGLFMSLLIAVLLVSTQAAADQQTAVPAQGTTPAPTARPAKVKKICKSEDADSGSHMARRVCLTAEEWNQKPQLGTGRSGYSISGEAMQSH